MLIYLHDVPAFQATCMFIFRMILNKSCTNKFIVKAGDHIYGYFTGIFPSAIKA